MDIYLHKHSRIRFFIALGIGISIGLLILLFVYIPYFIFESNEQAAGLIREENLISARGEAFSSFALADVSLTVLLDGKPNEGMAATVDFNNWYTPQNGNLKLSVVPGSYELISATYENRVVSTKHEFNIGEQTSIVLDVANAPNSPDLAIWDLPKGQDHVFPLEIIGADEIEMEHAPNGLSIIRNKGGFALKVDGNLTEYGFFSFNLKAKNEDGYSLMYIGLRIPRNEAVIPIYTVDDLNNIRKNLSGHYVIMNDLDMSAVDDWVPIGTEDYPFIGILDGGGYEIKGFHSPNEIGRSFALIDYTRNAELKNIIFREPAITPTSKEEDFGARVLVSVMRFGHVENCAIFGGLIKLENGNGGCLIGSNEYSISTGLFNSSTSVTRRKFMSETGGIMGRSPGYVAYCANEGEMSGVHTTGGISGYNNHGYMKNCINSGYIWGTTLAGEYPPGGIAQTSDFGHVFNCYFVRGQSALGNKAFAKSVINSLFPIDTNDLRDTDALKGLGSFSGDDPQWAFASLDANGPMPYGIFKKQAEAPIVAQSGNKFIIEPIIGVQYFYTVDGSNPYPNCENGAESIEITLKEGQALSVFAARQCYRDSDILIYQNKGGK